MRRNKTSQLALCALLGALAVIIMLMGGLIPLATFCCPMLAALLTVPVLYECGTKLAITWYGAVAILSCLLGPDKEAAAVYVFLGWYPILRPRLAKRKWLPRILAKLVCFNAAIAVMYSLLMYLFGMEALRQEFEGLGLRLLLGLVALGNVTFFLFDALLPRIEVLYVHRLRPYRWK